MLKTTPQPSPTSLTSASARWYDQVRAITESLMAINTVSPAVAQENECAQLIGQWLTQDTDLQPFYWPTHDGRFNVACLLKGTHPANTGRTIVLMGHYDTVGIKEFSGLGHDEAIALEPGRLREAVRQRLAHNRTIDEEEVWDDLNELTEGEPTWLFGRGSCDMKSGVAINLALIRALWQERDQLAGNILLLACPDEENESVGVRAAVPCLLDLRDEQKLTYIGLINTDYSAPRTAQDPGRSIYTGTIGKLLPSFYILGVPTHVGEPFRGVDAGHIAADLVCRLSLNTKLCDRWVREDPEHEGEMVMETGVPPIVLKMRDLKSEYNVQTAAEAFVYVNWLTYTTTPAEALQTMMAEARVALNHVLKQRNQQYQAFIKGGELPRQYEPRVYSFEQLCQLVRERQGWSADDLDFQQFLNQISAEVDAELQPHLHDEERIRTRLGYNPDLRTKSRLFVSRLINYAQLQGPAIIVFFSPPYYPHVQPEKNDLTRAFTRILHERHQNEQDTDMHVQGFYPYISDLSFVCLNNNIQEHLPTLYNNMPVFNRGYSLDFENMRDLNLSVMNIGPWGKDAHGLYERVHMPYSFEKVPQLIYEAISQVIKL